MARPGPAAAARPAVTSTVARAAARRFVTGPAIRPPRADPGSGGEGRVGPQVDPPTGSAQARARKARWAFLAEDEPDGEGVLNVDRLALPGGRLKPAPLDGLERSFHERRAPL